MVVGLGLCHFQSVFGIFDDDQRVALLDVLVFFETDFLDETLYTRADGRQVLLYLCVVRKFDVGQVDKSSAYPADASYQDEGNEEIGNGSFLVLYHICSVLFILS